MSSLEHFLPMQHELGGDPIWVPEENALDGVDIGQLMVYRIDRTTGEYQSYKPDMPLRGLCRRAAEKRVSRFNPSGKLEREIRDPIELVSCIFFGGENMDELYIPPHGMI